MSFASKSSEMSQMQAKNKARLERTSNMLQRRLKLSAEVIPVSSKTRHNFDKLQEAWKAALADRECFPNLGEDQPLFYDQFREKVLAVSASTTTTTDW